MISGILVKVLSIALLIAVGVVLILGIVFITVGYMDNKIMNLYEKNPQKFKELLIKFKKQARSKKMPNLNKLLSLFLEYFHKN